MSYKNYNIYQKYNTQAVAIGYKPGLDLAPKILATGEGILAEKIIDEAQKNDIPIKKDEDLIKILSLLELDNFIPMEAYSAVADILTSIYKYNDDLKAKKNNECMD